MGDSSGISVMKRLIGRPEEALLCAKAKRQLQSAQSERKSTTRFGDDPFERDKYINFPNKTFKKNGA